MQRVFITGGTGFFGKSTLDYLRRNPRLLADTTLYTLSRRPERFVAENPALCDWLGERLRWVQGDICTFTDPLAPDEKVDRIIHAAAAVESPISDDETHRTIVGGTDNLIRFAQRHATEKVLYVSSGAVYGPQTEPVSEDHACAPATAYGKAKLEAEQRLINSGLPTVIARCFTFTGPYLNRRIHFAIGNFMQSCLDGRPIVINGDGSPLRSYMYADDLAAWILALLGHGHPGRAYNVGSPEAISIRDLAETVRNILAPELDIKVVGSPSSGPASAYVPLVERAERELGLRVTVPLETAIRNSAATPTA